MTQDSVQNLDSKLPLEPPPGKISNRELASFLNRLAALYKSPTTGNPSLSAALNDLASQVSDQIIASKRSAKRSKQKSLGEPPLDLAQMRELDTKAVQEFIANEKRSKIELIELASARFSIPSSQLKRSKIIEVRETIKGACLHEDSINIISQDASRDGLKRSS